MTDLDLLISLWVHNNLSCDFLNTIMPIITKLGDGGILFITLGLLMLIPKSTRKMGFVVLLTVGVSAILTSMVLKPVFDRVRPYELLNMVTLIPPPHGSSFPSGHTTVAFAFAFSVWAYNKRYGILALILALLVAFSRVYLMVHYLSDVVAGCFVAYLCCQLVIYILNKVNKKTPLTTAR